MTVENLVLQYGTTVLLTWDPSKNMCDSRAGSHSLNDDPRTLNVLTAVATYSHPRLEALPGKGLLHIPESLPFDSYFFFN